MARRDEKAMKRPTFRNGRPRGSVQRVTLQAPVTFKEADEIREYSELTGLPVAEIVRQLIFGKIKWPLADAPSQRGRMK